MDKLEDDKTEIEHNEIDINELINWAKKLKNIQVMIIKFTFF